MTPKPANSQPLHRARRLEARRTEDGCSPLADRISMALFQEWETAGPPGIVDVKSLALAMYASVEQIREAADQLFSAGTVDRDLAQRALYLTPEGYDALFRQKLG